VKRRLLFAEFALVLVGLVFAGTLCAETGAEAWLRYARLDNKTARQYGELPEALITLPQQSHVMDSARRELSAAFQSLLGRTLRLEQRLPQEPAIILATLDSLHEIEPQLNPLVTLLPDGFWIAQLPIHKQPCLVITAQNERGVLYGAFALARKIGLGESLANINEVQNPSAPIRWVDQWDNLDGSIERGYAGRSIFFDNGKILAGNPRIGSYARILASVGINGCNINNVNANPHLLDDDNFP